MSKHSVANSRVAVLLLCGLGLVALASGQSVSGTVTSVAPKGGTWSKDVTSYDLTCSGGAFVTGFTITEDSSVPLDKDGEQNDILVASLWPLQCSDGFTVRPAASLRTLPKSRTYSSRRSTGYSGVTLYHGELVDGVAFPSVATKYGGSGGGKVSELACPAGQVITGIYGQASDSHVITVGLRCRSKEE